MGQHYFLGTSTIEKCVSHDQRKLQLVKKTCEENVESAIEVFLEEASSVNSCQKNIINEIIDVTIIILSMIIIN